MIDQESRRENIASLIITIFVLAVFVIGLWVIA